MKPTRLIFTAIILMAMNIAYSESLCPSGNWKEGNYSSGDEFLQKGNFVKAAEIFKQEAARCSGAAAVGYAKLLRIGEGGLKKDPYLAVEYLTAVVEEAKHVEAATILADIYLYGHHGIVKDPRKAVNFLKFAASDEAYGLRETKAHVRAKLALAYKDGLKIDGYTWIERDPHEALRLMQLAACCIPDAQYILGIMYFKGDGTEPDKTKAFHAFLGGAIDRNQNALQAARELYAKDIEVKKAVDQETLSEMKEFVSWFYTEDESKEWFEKNSVQTQTKDRKQTSGDMYNAIQYQGVVEEINSKRISVVGDAKQDMVSSNKAQRYCRDLDSPDNSKLRSLGFKALYGLGIHQNPELAARIWLTSHICDKLDPNSLLYLAQLYKEGVGVQKNLDLSRRFAESSAKYYAPAREFLKQF